MINKIFDVVSFVTLILFVVIIPYSFVSWMISL